MRRLVWSYSNGFLRLISLFFYLDFIGELFSHKQQQYFLVYEFHYHFTTASLQVSLYTFALNSLVGDTGRHPISSNRRPQPYQIESRPSEEEERVRENNDVKVSIFILAEYILFKNKAV